MYSARGLSFALPMALAGVLLSSPAAGHMKSDVGVFAGVAEVGKFGNCPQSGRGSVSGPGIGFPVTFPFGEILQKKGYWVIDTNPNPDPDPTWPDFFITVQHPEGLELEACGRLAPVNWTAKDVPGVPKVNIGASCGMSHGHDGWGTVNLLSQPHYRLRNIGWWAGMSDILPITADLWVFDPGGKDGTKTVGRVLMLTFAPANPPGNPDSCPSKFSPMKTADQGANRLNMLGVFAAYKFKGTPDADEPCEKKDAKPWTCHG